jgi:tRNA-specific 2-thiouridylase
VKGTVVVGMSGGVDSSVAALLLKQEGYRVIGLFMKNWEESDSSGNCQSTTDYEDVSQVCEQLDIPFYSVNFVREYWENVFSPCLTEYENGLTPNPDILCNKEIKFQVFFDKAMELNADYLATGHYCRNLVVDGQHRLGKGIDENKDQSYFLYAIRQEVLKKVLFPLGDLTKGEIRQIAEENGLATAAKKESMGICFIGKRNFRPFLQRYLKVRPGNFETPEGKVVGEHEGVAYYTIGQRKGLAIGGPGDAWYVVGKNIERNAVIVVQGDDHPALYSSELQAYELTWVGPAPSTFPFICQAKARYRQKDVPCTIERIENGELFVRFQDPQKAITPSQSIVFYDGDICLGGGKIREASPCLA